MFKLFKPDTTEQLEARLKASELAHLIVARHEAYQELQAAETAFEKAEAHRNRLRACVERLKCSP